MHLPSLPCAKAHGFFVCIPLPHSKKAAQCAALRVRLLFNLESVFCADDEETSCHRIFCFAVFIQAAEFSIACIGKIIAIDKQLSIIVNLILCTKIQGEIAAVYKILFRLSGNSICVQGKQPISVLPPNVQT